jgi:hypothetical protein
MGEIGSLITVVGTGIGIFVGILAVIRHFKPEQKSKILNPPSQCENGGRLIVVSGIVPEARRGVDYWVAVQPSDCRGGGLWWPQNERLRLDGDGSWTMAQVRLGREGFAAADDVGKTFTIGLIEVRAPAQDHFRHYAAQDDASPLPSGCRLIDSIEVRRVRY